MNAPSSRFYRGWAREISLACVGSGCIVAIVLILYYQKDQPLDTWKLPLNLNSTIAAFIAGAKMTSILIVSSCLGQRKWLHFEEKASRLRDLEVFDEASRGLWGSIKLIWYMRSRINLAMLGALVTILAFTVDFLAQQIVKFESQEQLSSQNPGIFWTTNIYNGGASVQDEASKPTQVERMFCLIRFSMNGILF